MPDKSAAKKQRVYEIAKELGISSEVIQKIAKSLGVDVKNHMSTIANEDVDRVRSELGRSAIHMGGAVQVFFGMRGKRWDGNPIISGFYNDAWTRPLPSERPRGTWRVEGSAYW